MKNVHLSSYVDDENMKDLKLGGHKHFVHINSYKQNIVYWSSGFLGW
jgi:hypothetical protein